MKNKYKHSKTSYTVLGLVFGTAIGAVLMVLFAQPIYWAGVGTGIGLILGAIIDLIKK